jgi:peroxiredoxin
LRSFQEQLPALEARGLRIVAISVDPPEASRTLRQKAGYTFSILSDVNAETIRRYDLFHRGAGPKGSDVARPAEFLVDSTGTIQWRNLTENIAVRARPDEVLKAFDGMKTKAAP